MKLVYVVHCLRYTQRFGKWILFRHKFCPIKKKRGKTASTKELTWPTIRLFSSRLDWPIEIAPVLTLGRWAGIQFGFIGNYGSGCLALILH
jgi:hypothetical protein